MDVVLYLINNSAEDILVCGRAQEACSALKYANCSFGGGSRIAAQQFGRLCITLQPPYEKLCLALWNGSSAIDSGENSPHTITTIDTTPHSLAIVAVWDGENIQLKDRYGRTPSRSNNLSDSKRCYFIHNQTQYKVYICHEGNGNCAMWTTNHNPCGHSGLLVEPNSIANLEMEGQEQRCMALWLNPSPKSGHTPDSTIEIDNMDSQLRGGEITISGTEPNAEFRLVDYFMESDDPSTIRSVRPVNITRNHDAIDPNYIPQSYAPVRYETSSNNENSGNILALIIIIFIIIIIIGCLAYAVGIYKGQYAADTQSRWGWNN